MDRIKNGMLNYIASLTNLDKISDGMCIIGLPYFMSDGDGVSVLVERKQDGTYTISDDGDTLNIHANRWVCRLPDKISEDDYKNMEKRLGDFSFKRDGLLIYKENIPEQDLYKEIFRLAQLVVEISYN